MPALRCGCLWARGALYALHGEREWDRWLRQAQGVWNGVCEMRSEVRDRTDL